MKPEARFSSQRWTQLAQVIFALSTIVASGCAPVSGPMKELDLKLGRNPRAPAPSELVASVSAVQRMSGRFAAREFSFPVVVEVDADRVVIAALTPVGNRGFLMEYDHGEFRYEDEPYFVAPIPPRQLLSAYLLLVAPTSWFEEHLPHIGLVVTRVGEFGLEVRAGTLPVLRITRSANSFWSGRHQLEHLRADYTLEVTTLELSALDAPPVRAD